MTGTKRVVDVVKPAFVFPKDRCRVIPHAMTSTRFACGHSDYRRYALSLDGRELRLSDEFFSEKRQCWRCYLDWLLPQLLRCPDCGKPIFPGQNVALPIKDACDDEKPYIATTTDEKQVVTCLCGENALGHAGIWTGDCIVLIDWEESLKRARDGE